MNYKLLLPQHANQIRKTFEKAFIMTQQEYDIDCSYWEKVNQTKIPDELRDVKSVLYWGKLKPRNAVIDFDKALERVASSTKELYFMSDPKSDRYVNNMHYLNNEESTLEFVATINEPSAFSAHIHNEWNYVSKFDDLGEEEWVDPLLPWDLYVFDDSFEWMIAFTHHNADDFSNKKADQTDERLDCNRLCYLCG